EEAATEVVRFDGGSISGLPAGNIGSATMSGRVAAVTAFNDKGRLTVFAGAASGGVWKSVNGGSSFRSVFDQPSVQSIGALAVDPTNTKIVRSEEHTSELQSLTNLVCRLLLEKKKIDSCSSHTCT